MMITNSIIKKVGSEAGKTVAIFAGVHGNEKVGIVALDKVIPDIEIKSGTVYFIYANPLAMEKNERMVNKNLNRLFSRSNSGDTYEDERASELMDILDECDALLDIHSYNSESGDQFAIAEPEGYEILKKMDFPIIASGFSELGDGTDSYMHRNGKIGICIECGTTKNYEKFVNLAIQSIYQFLQIFDCVENKFEFSNINQKLFKVKRMIYKESDDFRFTQEFKDFEVLPLNKPFAFDGSKAYTASVNEAILFPRPDAPKGGEVCIIGEFI